MILKTEPHLYLHIPSESVQSQLEGDILTISDVPPLRYCFAEEAAHWLRLSCNASEIVCPVFSQGSPWSSLFQLVEKALLHDRASAGWQESLGFLGCAHSYPKGPGCLWGSLQPSILNFPLHHVGDICALSTPLQTTQAPSWGREMSWRRKRRSNGFSPGGNLDPTPSLVPVGRDQPSWDCRKEDRELVFWAGNNCFLQPRGEQKPAHKFSQLSASHCFCNCSFLEQLLLMAGHQHFLSLSPQCLSQSIISVNSPRATDTETSHDLPCQLWEEASAFALFQSITAKTATEEEHREIKGRNSFQSMLFWKRTLQNPPNQPPKHPQHDKICLWTP